MKKTCKYSFVVMILALVLLTSACGSCGSPPASDVPVVTPDPTTPTASPTTPAQPPPPETSTFTPAKSLVTVTGKQGLYLSNYGKFPIRAENIEVSSVNLAGQGKENLVDGNKDTYWHAAIPRTSDDTWITVDLGQAASLDVLAILQRPENRQLWMSDKAILEGSNDGQNWEVQYRLGLNPAELVDREWIGFVFPEPTGSFRYFRLFVSDPVFLSLAGFALYGEGGIVSYDELTVITGSQNTDLSNYAKLPLTAENIEVSSVNQPSQGKENLIQGLGDPYWHVAFPRTSNDAWVMIDLGLKTSLDALAIRPRLEHPQLWHDNAAVLEGSNDGKNWIPQVRLKLNPAELNDQDWFAFTFKYPIGPFRYYRLFVSDPDFLSLGGLSLFGAGGVASNSQVFTVVSSLGVDLGIYTKIVITADNIEVSSINLPSQGGENLIDGTGDTYWHVAFPKTSDDAWIMISLDSQYKLAAIAILPRTDPPQLWSGSTALLEGSNDGKVWRPLAQLDLTITEFTGQGWITFVFPNSIESFSYYRIYIDDVHFLSLGDIAFYCTE